MLLLRKMITVGYMMRRHFIKTFCRLALAAVAAGPMPAWTEERTGMESPTYTYGKGPDLVDVVRQKKHHTTGGFLNPFGPDRQGGFGRLLRWKLFSRNRYKRFYHQESVTPVSVDWPGVYAAGGVSVTFLKHASLLIGDMGDYLLLDPGFSDIFRFIKDFSPLAFSPDKIPSPRHVLITHGHYDHLDTSSLSRLSTDAHVVTPLGYDRIFDNLKISRHTQLDWFESITDGGRQIVLLPSKHWTMRNPLVGPNTNLWGAFLVKTAGGPVIFLSGDTAYFDGFKEIGERYDIDLAVINLGAYEPRWFMKGSHLNPAETVQAFRDLKARKLMIIHWGTFRLGDEPVHFPPIELRREMEKAKMLDRLVDIRHGETYFMA